MKCICSSKTCWRPIFPYFPASWRMNFSSLMSFSHFSYFYLSLKFVTSFLHSWSPFFWGRFLPVWAKFYHHLYLFNLFLFLPIDEHIIFLLSPNHKNNFYTFLTKNNNENKVIKKEIPLPHSQLSPFPMGFLFNKWKKMALNKSHHINNLFIRNEESLHLRPTSHLRSRLHHPVHHLWKAIHGWNSLLGKRIQAKRSQCDDRQNRRHHRHDTRHLNCLRWKRSSV